MYPEVTESFYAILTTKILNSCPFLMHARKMEKKEFTSPKFVLFFSGVHNRQELSKMIYHCDIFFQIFSFNSSGNSKFRYHGDTRTFSRNMKNPSLMSNLRQIKIQSRREFLLNVTMMILQLLMKLKIAISCSPMLTWQVESIFFIIKKLVNLSPPQRRNDNSHHTT